jgi:Fe-S cluster assembly protein SufD
MKKLIVVPQSKKERTYTISSPGDYVFFLMNAQGKLIVNIKGAKANAYIFGMYVGRKTDTFQIQTVQHHLVGNNISDLFVKGVFFDKSRFEYEGLIRIEKGANGSHAYQKNQNFVMSDKCFVDSRPFLEILANDVFCTHGSTTGKPNQEELYYLMTRGLSKKNAESLLIEGFFNEVFWRMEDIIPEKKVRALKTKAMAML